MSFGGLEAATAGVEASSGSLDLLRLLLCIAPRFAEDMWDRNGELVKSQLVLSEWTGRWSGTNLMSSSSTL